MFVSKTVYDKLCTVSALLLPLQNVGNFQLSSVKRNFWPISFCQLFCFTE